MEQIGVGEDGEPLLLEEKDGEFLIHAKGNESSPFPFSKKQYAIAFAEMLSSLRMVNRVEEILNHDR